MRIIPFEKAPASSSSGFSTRKPCITVNVTRNLIIMDKDSDIGLFLEGVRSIRSHLPSIMSDTFKETLLSLENYLDDELNHPAGVVDANTEVYFLQHPDKSKVVKPEVSFVSVKGSLAREQSLIENPPFSAIDLRNIFLEFMKTPCFGKADSAFVEEVKKICFYLQESIALFYRDPILCSVTSFTTKVSYTVGVSE